MLCSMLDRHLTTPCESDRQSATRDGVHAGVLRGRWVHCSDNAELPVYKNTHFACRYTWLIHSYVRQGSFSFFNIVESVALWDQSSQLPRTLCLLGILCSWEWRRRWLLLDLRLMLRHEAFVGMGMAMPITERSFSTTHSNRKHHAINPFPSDYLRDLFPDRSNYYASIPSLLSSPRQRTHLTARLTASPFVISPPRSFTACMKPHHTISCTHFIMPFAYLLQKPTTAPTPTAGRKIKEEKGKTRVAG